jgi:hypothetical protein
MNVLREPEPRVGKWRVERGVQPSYLAKKHARLRYEYVNDGGATVAIQESHRSSYGAALFATAIQTDPNAF